MPPNKLKKLQDLLALVSEGLTREEFDKAYEDVLKMVAKIASNQAAKIDKEIAAATAKLRSGNDGKDGKDGKDGRDGKDGARGEKGDTGATGRAIFGGKGDPGKDGKDGSPDTPQQVRDKLESLTEDERLDISVLKGLDELRKEFDAKLGKASLGAAPRASQAMRFYDLSSQTNGTLKVFTVPKGLAAVVISSDFPSVLMEGNGFTLNGTRTQLTLTTTTAPSSGSQLLYQYTSIFN